MYEGYLSLGGTEIVNVARTETYLRKNAPLIPFRGCVPSKDLNLVLGDDEYESPIVDDAPWYDRRNEATNRFFGVYPLEIQGAEDSTRTAEVTESIVDGGSVGAVRFGTRTIRVRAALFAGDSEAMVAGMTWLRNALDPAPCNEHGGSCGGAQLCFYAALPEICDIYEPTYQLGNSIPIFRETPATSPVLFQLPYLRDSVWRASLDLTPGFEEGLILRWGAVSEDDTEEIVEQHGPVVFKRVNYVLNSAFEEELDFWSYTGGTAVVVEGGNYGETIYGDGIYGGTLGKYLARSGGTEDGLSTVTLRTDSMQTYSGGIIASFNLWTNVGAPTPYVQARLRNADTDEVLAEANFLVSQNPTRYSFTALYGGACYIEFETGGAVNIDSVMLEAGATPLPYFDGSTPVGQAMNGYITGEIENEYTIVWRGIPHRSASQIVWNGKVVIGTPMAEFPESQEGTCKSFPFLTVVQGTISGDLDISQRPRISNARQTERLERTMHDVTCVEGPTIISESKFLSGAVMREVDFLLVVGRPTAYGPTLTVLGPSQRMSDLDTIPWPDLNCTIPEPTPIIDPDCPPVPAPPRPPSIVNACVTPQTFWQRYWLPIADDEVAAWSGTSPTVTITSGALAIRQMRVRVYPNEFNRDPDEEARTNLLPRPKPYTNLTDYGTTGGASQVMSWSANGGPQGQPIAINTVSTATPVFGIRVGPANGYAIPAGLVPNVDTMHFSVLANISAAAQGLRISVTWYNASNGVITNALSDAVAGAADAWRRIHFVDLIPTGAVRFAVSVQKETTSASGQILRATEFLAEASEAPEAGVDTRPYFDGDTPAALGQYYGWSGTVRNSASVAITSPVDPCAWCAEFIVSYLPPQTTLTVDAILERAFASVAGGEPAPANHLLYSADGAPMTWPELTCGTPYLFAIDVPEPLLDDVLVTVELTTKE